VGKLPRGNRLVGLLLFDHVYDELFLAGLAALFYGLDTAPVAF